MGTEDNQQRFEPSDALASFAEQQLSAGEPVWLAPPQLPPAYAAPNAARLPMYDLRPLTMGEVLDRTFSVYRSKFWLFAGISAVPGIFQSIAMAAQMRFQQNLMSVGPTGVPDFRNLHFGTAFAVMGLGYLLSLLTIAQTQAATAFAVGEVYLGRPVTIGESFRATIDRWLAFIGIALWQFGSMLWIPLVLIVPGILLIALLAKQSAGWAALGGFLIFAGFLGGGVLGYIQYLRNSMAVPAAVVERLTVRASIRRSKVLSPGAKGRIFVVLLITGCLYLVVGMLQMPLTMFMAFSTLKGHESVPALLMTLLLNLCGRTVVTPVTLIGITLVYFDQRVRKEAFDIAMLLDEDIAVERGAPVAAAASPSVAPVVPVAPSLGVPPSEGAGV